MNDETIQDEVHLHRLARGLARRDPNLKRVVRECGLPPLWRRPATFESLARIVLEQHVSLHSARAVAGRLAAACGGRITAAAIRRQDLDTLGRLGVTRQKSRYLCGLAERVESQELSLRQLAHLSNRDAAARLCDCNGIGPWTAGIYLMTALQRADIVPIGDRGLVVGLSELLGAVTTMTYRQVDVYCQQWAPQRTVGVVLIWQSYLERRGQAPREAARRYGSRP